MLFECETIQVEERQGTNVRVREERTEDNEMIRKVANRHGEELEEDFLREPSQARRREATTDPDAKTREHVHPVEGGRHNPLPSPKDTLTTQSDDAGKKPAVVQNMV